MSKPTLHRSCPRRGARHCVAWLAALATLCWGGTLGATNAFHLGDAIVAAGAPVTLDITMDADADVQGFVLAGQHDSPGGVEVIGVDAEGATLDVGAELVIGQLYPLQSGFTLGVVLDVDAPFEGQTIAAGTDTLIAQVETAFTGVVTPPFVVAFDFVDGLLGDPLLDNVMVQQGLSIGVAQGLQLTSGSLAIKEGIEQLIVEDTEIGAPPSGCAPVRILLDNLSPVQGFVLAIAHDGGILDLVDITLDGTASSTAGVEFAVVDLDPAGALTGGTLGVVLDFEAPYDGQTIAPGTAQHIASYHYCCIAPPAAGEPPLATAIEFVDGELGSPPLDNVLVEGGLSVNPNLVDGSASCLPLSGTPSVAFFCGPVEGAGELLSAPPGDEVDVCFYYTSDQALQGFQIAICFDCQLEFGPFGIEGTIVESVGADFVNSNVDNDPDDGDGCELVAGVLLDALPPFDGQTIPPSVVPLAMGCATAVVSPEAACDSTLFIDFCDGVDGAGTVPIENIAIIDFQSIQDVVLTGCDLFVAPVPIFRRGDCNGDDKVDLADAAATLGVQFFGYLTSCDDACDANDDGNINLADTIFLVNYLFKFGDMPPDPGPLEGGEDPTDDDPLDCEVADCGP